MEEEKKIEETSTEPKHEVEEAVEEKKETPFLEPRPYKRQSKAETDETATVPSKDTEEADETQEATPEKVERPVNAEDKVFKKRYDDLKRHYDSAVNKHKEEVFNLKINWKVQQTLFHPRTKRNWRNGGKSIQMCMMLLKQLHIKKLMRRTNNLMIN